MSVMSSRSARAGHIHGFPTRVPELPILIISGAVLLAAAVTTALAASGDASLPATMSIAQSVISIGVLIVTAVLGARCRGWTLLEVALLLPVVVSYGVIMTTAGVLITVVVTASNGEDWEPAGVVFTAPFVAQSVAGLIGLGLGTMIGRPVVAGLMTIIIPLGLLILLGLVVPAAQPWLTPFWNAWWWSDTMTTDGWPQFLVTVLPGCGVLNAAGWIAQTRRSRNPESSRRRHGAGSPIRRTGQRHDIADRAAFRTIPQRWI